MVCVSFSEMTEDIQLFQNLPHPARYADYGSMVAVLQ
jgi:hypothetical protein